MSVIQILPTIVIHVKSSLKSVKFYNSQRILCLVLSLFTYKYVTSYLVFVPKYVCMCKPSLLYYYARLSRNTLDWRIKTKVEREEEEEDHLLVNVSIIYSETKILSVFKTLKRRKHWVSFSLFFCWFWLLLLRVYSVLCWLHLFWELFLVLKLLSHCNKV